MTSIQQRDAQSVLTGIDELLPALRERAQATEDLRRLPDENVKALDEVGFFKQLQPRQWGGLQCDPTIFYEAVRRLASACGSTGWVASILGVHNWHLAQFDQAAQDEVWGEDPTVRISSSYAPMGGGTVVDGGYLVHGAWNWSSGCDHATWAFLGGPVIKDDRPVDFGSFLIPRAEYTVDDVWHVVGLKGTGSNTVVVNDVFVPGHRFLSYRQMNDHAAAGLRKNTAPCIECLGAQCIPPPFRHPSWGWPMARTRRTCSIRASGSARRSPARWPGTIRSPRSGSPKRPATSTPRGGKLIGNIGDEYALLREGGEIPFELRARARRDQVRAAGRAIASIDRLFEASGATALSSDAPVQRFWRDAHAGRVHAANDPERAYVIFGNHEFGLPPQDTMV